MKTKILIILIVAIIIIGGGVWYRYSQIPCCPESCDDGNPCTKDFCSSETNYQCEHSPIVGATEGCQDLVETCKQYQCLESECQIVTLADCCGNGKCDVGEDWETCPQDCERCDDGNPCTEDSFDYDQQKCMTKEILPCCGNGKCEFGETYEECAGDCVKTGNIEESEVWGGTIHVTGDIEVESWVTLTILPGTTVYIAANSDDTNKGREETSAFEHEDPIRKKEYAKNHIEINAKIIARGTPDNKILFTSDAQDKKFADWQHIGLEEGSVIDNVIVEYGGRGGLSVNGKGEDVTISNSTIRHVLWGCIGLGSSSAKVIGNEIYDCGHEGIDTQPGGGKPTIKNNTIKNSARGFMLNDDSFPLVENNTIIDNAIGIEVRGGGEIINNYISSPNGPANDWVYENFVYKRNAPRAHTGGPDSEPRTGIITTGKATLSGNIIENIELEIKVEG